MLFEPLDHQLSWDQENSGMGVMAQLGLGLDLSN
jgi:hypothetical protein